MLKSRLNIDGTDVAFSDVLSISTNYLIADIREPSKRNSDYSKTITIPGTEDVHRLFQFIFEVNTSLTTFNPNLKTPVTYFVNEIPVFSGDLQLLRINKKEIAGVWEVNYECFILGTNSDLFLEIGDSLLTDLDFSDLDHTFDDTSDKYNPAAWGTGYYYGLIDYGVTGGNSSTWTFDHLKPAIFEKEYIDRIFLAAGKTYTSSFFNSDYYKRIVIPDVNQGRLRLPKTTIENSQFYATQTTQVAGNSDVGTEPYLGINGRWGYQFTNNELFVPVEFDDDSTPPYNDPGNVYNTGTHIFTAGVDGYYQAVAGVSIICDITAPAGAYVFPVQVVGSMQLEIQVSTDSGSTWSNIGSTAYVIKQTADNEFSPVGGSPPSSFDHRFYLQASNSSTFLNAGDMLRVAMTQVSTAFTAQFEDNLNNAITSGNSTMEFSIDALNPPLSSSIFYVNLNPPDLQYGGNVVVNDTVPQNIKQIDFLTSVIKCENLYIERDKDNENNYIIEPREDFYTGDFFTWTSKLDISSDFSITPMGELDAKKYVFKYKEDGDHFNKLYQDEYKEPYGSWDTDITNEFLKETKEISVIFSGTPSSGNNTNDIVAPVLAKTSGAGYAPMACNIRRLYAAGLIPCSGYNWVANNVTTFKNEYPYIGHLDDPINPTVDLCFGKPYKIYWKIASQSYTDNNRFNEQYSKYISEITDPESKIINCKMYLTENDISQLTFRKIAYVRDAYYYINKVEGYDPQYRNVCDVELLKLKEGIPFIGNTFVIIDENDLSTDRIMSVQQPFTDVSGNASVPGAVVIGTGNNILESGSFVIGNNNVISGTIG